MIHALSWWASVAAFPFSEVTFLFFSIYTLSIEHKFYYNNVTIRMKHTF